MVIADLDKLKFNEEYVKYNHKTGIFHLYLTLKFKEKLGLINDSTIKLEEANKVLWFHGIPKRLTHQFLKEMEQFKLIKLINKQNIQILK